MIVSIPIFKGIRPLLEAELIGENEAQTAENCYLDKGHLNPWDNYLLTELLEYKGTVKTVYLYEDEYWLEWEADVDIVPAPVSGDTESKIYYTGDGIPKKSDLDEIITGSGAMPINFYPLMVPNPAVAPTAAANPPPAGSGDDREITYIWTVVTDWGEEGYPSAASAVVTAKNGEKVSLSNMTMEWQAGKAYTVGNFVFEVADEGGTYVYKCVQPGTSGAAEPTWIQTVDGNTIDNTVIWRCYKNILSVKRIYRLNTGNEYANYEYVDEIAIAATSYDDTKTDSELSSACPSLSENSGGSADQDWDPPIDELQGLCYLGNGILLAFNGKDLYASIAYRPWAWPTAYMQSLSSSIVAITPIGANQAIITTENEPYMLVGTAPGSITIEPFPESRACLSKRGAIAYKGGCVYPAADGLRMVNLEENLLLTQEYYSTKEWKDLYPSTIHGVVHGNKYFGFYSSGGNEGGIVIDLITGVITTLNFYSSAIFVDPKTDTLYFLRSNEMSLFNERLLNPDARSTSGKATQFDLDATGALEGISQPDYPRNLVLTITDANASLTALQVTITGILATGETEQTEVCTEIAAGSYDLNKAWAHIDSITVDSVSGGAAADKLDVGWGKKFGFGNAIDDESDVIKVNIDEDDSDVSSQTISTTYDTIQFETDPDAAHDYQIWYATD